MIDSETGLSYRSDMVNVFKEFADLNISDGCRFASVYGKQGIGKTSLLRMIGEAMGKEGSEFAVFSLSVSSFCNSYPENGLIALRDSCRREFKDFFTLFDICCLVRSERINGKLPREANSYFTNNTSVTSAIFLASQSKNGFTRNMYEAVGTSVPREWFDASVRPYVSRIFSEANQRSWEALVDSFAECLAELKKATGVEPLLLVDDADQLFSSYDDGKCWIVHLLEKAGCGTALYASEDRLDSAVYGALSLEIPVEGLSHDDTVEFLKAKGFSRDALAEIIYENTSGYPALTAYSAEAFNLMKKSEGHEPSPDVFESDPQSVVHMHLSCLAVAESSMAKILSCSDSFDAGLFKALSSEFVPDADGYDGLFDSFISYCFVKPCGDGKYCIHPLYRKHAVTALDSDLLENVNYSVYRYHMRETEIMSDQYDGLYHISRSVAHAMTVMNIDGFVEWFNTLEKTYYNNEFFNFWLGMLEKAKAYISGILGDTHPDIAAYYDKLAFMYLKSGRTTAAEKVLQQRLATMEDKAGKNTGDTVPVMNKLAAFYSETGDFAAAEAISRKGLEIREQFKGKNSAEYADSMVKIGRIKLMEGDRKSAVEHMDEATEIFDKTLDVKDAARLEADEVMASVYSAAGHIAKAALIYHKITSVKNEQLGPYNKEAIDSLKNYAKIIFTSGNGRKAVKLYEDLINKTKKIYGENSRMTASVANDLAVAYQKVQEFEKSESMQNEAISIKKQVYGTNHPSTAVSFTNYGQLKYLMGDLKNAEPYYYKALQIYELVFGEKHERTATGLNNMGFITSRMGQFDRAEEYYKKALDIKLEVGGERSVSAAAAMNNLGELLYRLGKKDEARDFLQKALDIYNEILGEEHEYSKIVAKNLVAVN